MPGGKRTTPATALRRQWAARDGLYATNRKHRLTDAEIASVRAWRAGEVDDLLSGPDRTQALIDLSSWAPPAPPR